jgi:hypothetical protein
MSEVDRVRQIQSNVETGTRVGDELMYHPGTKTIGPSSGNDPDRAVRITKPDTDLFGNRR